MKHLTSIAIKIITNRIQDALKNKMEYIKVNEYLNNYLYNDSDYSDNNKLYEDATNDYLYRYSIIGF